MKVTNLFLLTLCLLTAIACSDNTGFSNNVEIPDFDFPKSVDFEDKLSSYNIFQGSLSNLNPSDEYKLLELSSVLFTDYAHKQRLIKIPSGEILTKSEDGSINFPDNTILTKTFYYYNDERDTNQGKRIIETRLLIKKEGIWNVATYIWNEDQSDALFELNGLDTDISWINSKGTEYSIKYHIPNENECITCHQSNSKMTPLGTKLRNLNREVNRNGIMVNQIQYLQSIDVLEQFQLSSLTDIVDYKDLNNSLNDKGRAYLAMNCAHCHNPSAWFESARQDLDFRYETPINKTGILTKIDRIERLVLEREMPFIGTSILDQEGVELMVEYLESQK